MVIFSLPVALLGELFNMEEAGAYADKDFLVIFELQIVITDAWCFWFPTGTYIFYC